MNDDFDTIMKCLDRMAEHCGSHGHKWGEWRRNYRHGGFTRACEKCGQYQRRTSDPMEVPYDGR